MGTKVKINLDSAETIKINKKLNKGGPAELFFSSEVARLSDPYVPMDTRTLKKTRQIEAGKITYPQPYAKRQWYEHKGKGLRGPKWCLRMWANRGKEIAQSVAKFIGGAAK